MTNSVSEEQGRLVVKLHGEVDLENAGDGRKTFLDCIARKRDARAAFPAGPISNAPAPPAAGRGGPVSPERWRAGVPPLPIATLLSATIGIMLAIQSLYSLGL